MKKYLVISLLALAGCGFEEESCIEAPDVDNSITVNIERLENRLFASETPADVLQLLNENPVMTKGFLGSDQYPSDTILAQQIFRVIKNPYTDTLRMETQKYFGDMGDIKKEFESAFSYIKHYYPDFEVPEIKTMVTGFGGSEMFVNEKLIVLGLDFYLGPNGKYRPNGIPGYILERYDKPYIVPATVLLYADRYLRENPQDNSMAADMVYYGKKYFFAKNMMPCTPDSLLIWYDGDELANVEENKHLLWYHFLENELLYETSHVIKQKYMDERPNIYEIGSECPGRIGAWIGWDIVKQYHDLNPDISLQEIMVNPDAQEILKGAKYNPLQ
ncbi:MAG: gliding motility lipoprotein GldB [Bacteroidota bacterium]